MKMLEKVAVVTGAAGGIGRAITVAFCSEGATVVAADQDEQTVQTLAATLQNSNARVSAAQVDVTDRKDADRLIDGIIEKHGRIDVLVNNAGIMDGFAPLGELDDELWGRVMAVNLEGPMLLSRKALPAMVDRGGGVIVNVASLAGLHGGRAGAAYTASKHALIGLTKNVAWHYADKGVRCVAVAPGGVDSGIPTGEPNPLGWQRLEPLLAADVRPGSPNEVARAVLFLASEDASFVNGAVLVADAGWSAG